VRWTAALSASCLVAGALRTQNVSATGVLDSIGLRLGDASYALYLCHVPIIILSGHLLPAAIPAWVLWIGWSCAAIAAALCLGPLDLRLHRRLKRWASSLPRRRIAALSLAFLAAFFAIAGYFDLQSRMNAWAQDKARAALASTEAQSYPSVRTAIESTALMPDGRLNVRGYGIDLDSPDDDGHIAIEQGGQIIAVDRMRRLMNAMALKFARPDLKSIRFGFSLVSPDVFDCSKGPLEAKFVFPDGRVTAVVGGALGTICQSSPPATKP
jgi:exopolysaccharide production protein ExoZ